MYSSLYQWRREPAPIRQQVAAISPLIVELRVSWRSPVSALVGGWALVLQGQGEAGIVRKRQALVAHRESGLVNRLPYFFALLAEGYLVLEQSQVGLQFIGEALAIVEETGERWWEAELYRLKGLLQQQQGDSEAAVEVCFRRAIEIARRQEAKSLEPRATVSLSHCGRLKARAQPLKRF